MLPDEAEETARVFDLLLGDNLAGRKDYIAENGHLYLDTDRRELNLPNDRLNEEEFAAMAKKKDKNRKPSTGRRTPM